MATQAQGKGKKKNKDVTKLSLDEFDQIDAPHGHSVVNVKATGFDWAAAIADHEKTETETQIIMPGAQRGPGVDHESLPNEPPFRVSGFGQRSGDRFGDRSAGGGFGRDRDTYSGGGGGFGRTGGGGGGFGQSRGGHGDRYNDSRSNFRDINRGQYTSGGGEPDSEESTKRHARAPVKPSPPVTPAAAAAALAKSPPSSYYAGAKFLTPPIPSLLPMPPESWLRNRNRFRAPRLSSN